MNSDNLYKKKYLKYKNKYLNLKKVGGNFKDDLKDKLKDSLNDAYNQDPGENFNKLTPIEEKGNELVDIVFFKQDNDFSPGKTRKINNWGGLDSDNNFIVPGVYDNPFETRDNTPDRAKMYNGSGFYVILKEEYWSKLQGTRNKKIDWNTHLVTKLGLLSSEEQIDNIPKYQFMYEGKIRAKDLYRPCIDPEINDNSCDYKKKNYKKPRRIYPSDYNISDMKKNPSYWLWDSNYENRYKKRHQDSYTINASGEPIEGYPFTGFGYTYDISQSRKSSERISNKVVGLSEYIARPGSKIIISSLVLHQTNGDRKTIDWDNTLLSGPDNTLPSFYDLLTIP